MKKLLQTFTPYLDESLRIIFVLFAIFTVLIFITEKSQALFFRFTLDYGEAPLVDQALRLANGQNIYRKALSTPPYTISNYPPLYPLAMAPFVALFGPAFWPGRLISALSALATALFLAQIVRAQTGERAAGRVAAVVFLAIPFVVSWSSLARVDLLALALSTAGLAVLSRRAATHSGLIAGALLLVAAIYTRQSYGLAAPLAACVWLWKRYGWRRAALLAGIVGAVGLLLFVTLNLATQGGFFFNIVTANVNPFGLERLLHHWREVRRLMPLLLGLGALGLGVTAWSFFATRNTEVASQPTLAWMLVGPYLIGATFSAATIGKIGSNVNYLLEFAAALSLAAGVWAAGTALPRPLNTRTTTAITRQIVLVLLIIQLGWLMQETLKGPVQALKVRRQPTAKLYDLLEEVRHIEGPILADEFMGMLTLNAKPLYLQPFEVTQLANAGLWDQTPLLESIRAQEFPMILIHHFMGYPVYTERWTPEMLEAILKYYIADGWAGETLIFRPRNPVIHPPATLTRCPDAPWRLPTRADMGVWWLTQGLIFMGAGFEGNVPVYAVADGLLMRPTEWHDAVAILHEDPVRPGEKVWSFYGGMASGWDGRSLIATSFPPGTENMPVQQGQLLGYQGTWHRPGMVIWPHSFFGVAQPLRADGSFPLHVLTDKRPSDPDEPLTFLDPSPYLGTAIRSPVMGTPVWFPLRCLRMPR